MLRKTVPFSAGYLSSAEVKGDQVSPMHRESINHCWRKRTIKVIFSLEHNV